MTSSPGAGPVVPDGAILSNKLCHLLYCRFVAVRTLLVKGTGDEILVTITAVAQNDGDKCPTNKDEKILK